MYDVRLSPVQLFMGSKLYEYVCISPRCKNVENTGPLNALNTLYESSVNEIASVQLGKVKRKCFDEIGSCPLSALWNWKVYDLSTYLCLKLSWRPGRFREHAAFMKYSLHHPIVLALCSEKREGMIPSRSPKRPSVLRQSSPS